MALDGHAERRQVCTHDMTPYKTSGTHYTILCRDVCMLTMKAQSQGSSALPHTNPHCSMVITPLRLAQGMVFTCRLCVAVMQSTAWASAAVRALLASLHALQQAMASQKGPWLSKCALALLNILSFMFTKWRPHWGYLS